MAARSTLTVTSGTTITSAWGNSMRDHVVPSTTSNDVASEGQLASNTSTDRLMVYDGAAAQRLAHWSSTGRTWCTKDENGGGASSIGSGSLAQIAWSGGTDADSFYTGWSGSNYLFTVPSGLGGLYAITVVITWTTAWTTATSDYIRIGVSSSAVYDFAPQSTSGYWTASIACVPLASTDSFYVALHQASGSAKTISATGSKIYVTRLGI